MSGRNQEKHHPKNITALFHDQALPGGLTVRTFATEHGNKGNKPRWSTYNDHVPLYTTFTDADRDRADADHAAAVALRVLIHADPADADAVPVQYWQLLRARVARTPSLPAIPQRLVTSFTWADSSLLYDPPAPSPESPMTEASTPASPFLSLYRRLGFNAVPMVGMPAQTTWDASSGTAAAKPGAPAELLPAGRRGPGWAGGMLFGPEVSSPDVSGAPSVCRHYAPNASMLPPGLSAAETKAELVKWGNAHAYSQATGNLDIAYDGVFARENTRHFCALMAMAQPDWVFTDDEGFGEGWVPWLATVASSHNAARARAAK